MRSNNRPPTPRRAGTRQYSRYYREFQLEQQANNSPQQPNDANNQPPANAAPNQPATPARRQVVVELIPNSPRNQLFGDGSPGEEQAPTPTSRRSFGTFVQDSPDVAPSESGMEGNNDLLMGPSDDRGAQYQAMSRRRWAFGNRTDEARNAIRDDERANAHKRTQVTPWIKKKNKKIVRYYAIEDSDSSTLPDTPSPIFEPVPEINTPSPPKRARRNLLQEFNQGRPAESIDAAIPFVEREFVPGKYLIRVYEEGPPFLTERMCSDSYTTSGAAYSAFPFNAPIRGHNINTLDDALTILRGMFEKDNADLAKLKQELEQGEFVCVLEFKTLMICIGKALVFPCFE
ncbi:Oidioi.mRNA.OKI2018_I69.chr1.g1455.t1.cds [Oikopleura dioica]|uniref:Oidioi.mRNA.OKI2018_I69.chr1.g1455.t1.cds n=1 Tax=Oikopleura dioica TaxID=34765 RepID=A0ABN7SPN7_OIKDI|nr:Oidioi.mRNA.OKI2018_I69.chr1.g1455.t1.cds [Oikopleura dioica]